MTDFSHLFHNQKYFHEKIASEYAGKTKVDKIKDYCVGINRNVTDVLNTTDWDVSKEPKDNSEIHQKVEALDAVVDIIKYAINICIEHEIIPEMLDEHLIMKTITVEQKLRQKKYLKSDEFKKVDKVFVFDIDGVLADIVKAYLSFYYSQTSIKFSTFEELLDWQNKNLEQSRVIKEKYRLCGYKSVMPAIEGALELIQFAASKGCVALLSNRPVKTYPILYVWTVMWLENMDMLKYVNMLHFTDLGAKKYFFERFEGKKVYFFEDNVYNISNRPGVVDIFVRNETNKNVEKTNCIEINNLFEAVDFIRSVC